jgi:hypothetical protein
MSLRSSRWRSGLGTLVLSGILLCGTSSAWALITGGFGNDPVPDSNWPQGAVDLANLKTRLGWWEGPPFGGGEYHFLYRGDAKALNEALELLSKIDAPKVEVEVHSGPNESFWLVDRGQANPNEPKKPARDPRVDWEFVIWSPANYHHLFNHPQALISADQENFHQPIPAPKLEVFIGGGLIEWKDVKVPQNVHVIDQRAAQKPGAKTATLTGKVYNVLTSKAVPKATVSVVQHNAQGKREAILTAETDDKGIYKIEEIPAVDRTTGYSVWIEAAGLAPRDVGYRSYLPGSTQNFITYLSPLEKVQGRVVDDNNQPVAGARVAPFTILGIDGKGYTLPNRPETKSDADGRFTLELPKGSAYLSCRFEQLHQKEFLKLHEIPAADLILEMEGTGKVVIRLINDQNQPLADKVVSLEPRRDPRGKWGGMSNTNAQGEVTFEGVPSGEYIIRPDGPNGKHTKVVTIRSGKPNEISFTTK